MNTHGNIITAGTHGMKIRWNRCVVMGDVIEIRDEILMPLRELYDMLESPFCTYSQGGNYTMFDDGKPKVMPVSEIFSMDIESPRENVTIATFKDDLSRVAYAGKDPESMRKTLDRLKLPSSPQNLGEKLFRLFRGYLEEAVDDPIHLEQKITPGSEYRLELVLRKFNHVYSSKKIDREFYQSIRQQA